MFNADEALRRLTSQCRSANLLSELHAEAQDAIIDAAELGRDDVAGALALYALAAALATGVVEGFVGDDSLSGEVARLIECASLAMRGLDLSKCIFSNVHVAEAFIRVKEWAPLVRSSCLNVKPTS